MASLYATSKTWRKIVDATRQNKGYMLAFAATCIGVPLLFGDQVMQTTSKVAAREEGELEKKLRSRSGIQAQMLAKAQRERLQVMLDEIKSGGASSEARYRAALDGQSLGTHSSGSSAHAVAIQRPGEAAAQAAAAGEEQPAKKGWWGR